MSTDNASPPLVIPSTVTSINSLPLEIKTLIVKLAKIQDDNFNKRAFLYQLEDNLCGDLVMSNGWRGRSLNALFLTNKEWSDLAAVHLFKVLSAEQFCSIIFKCYILYKRAHLFQEVRFERTYPANILSAFTALPLFTNVKSLYLESDVIEILFGESELGSSENEDFNDSFQYFCTFGKQVTRLQIDIFTSSSIGILAALPYLKVLEFVTIGSDGEEQKLIGNALAALPLESLTLDFGVRDQTLKYFSELSWTASSTLRLLEIRCLRFGIVHMEFIQLFSTSLERLELSHRTVSGDISSFKFTSPLIKLQHLSIISDSNSFPVLFQLFSASPIITLVLEECTFRADNSIASLISTPLNQLIDKSICLKQIEINDRYAPGTRYTTLSQLCKSKNIVLNLTTWDQQYLLEGAEDYVLSDENFVTSAIPHLKDALDFGNRRLVELEKDEDVEGMKEMFENCRWLRAHAALQKD